MRLVGRSRRETGDGVVHIFWCVCTGEVSVISGGAMFMSMYGHTFSFTYL